MDTKSNINANEKLNEGKQITLLELKKEVDKLKTKWFKIPTEEAEMITFTGNIKIREQIFKDKLTHKDLPPSTIVDFEMAEKLEGTNENRIYSRNIKNSDVKKLVDFLSQGHRTFMISGEKSGKVNIAIFKNSSR